MSPAYAAEYGAHEWESGVNEGLLDQIESWAHGLSGKRVLDLGGGPGQYSVAFARRGAQVTWYDVSRSYLEIAKRHVESASAQVDFVVGYMDEARRHLHEPFDVVFNRICWYYCTSDRTFARVVYDLVKPGGIGYVDTPHASARTGTVLQRMRGIVNEHFGVKIGHPFPPHGRVARLLLELPMNKVLVDYTSPANDRVLFAKRDDRVRPA